MSRKTIRRQLLTGLFCGALLCILAAGLALYRGVREEANELADMQLRQIAGALPNLLEAGVAMRALGDPEEEFVIQAWSAEGAPLYASPPELALPRYQLDGLRTVKVRGQRWRIYVLRRGGRIVQVSQRTSERDKLAASLALRILLPLLLMLPVLGALIYVVVGRALRPLDRVAQAVAGRSPRALQPLALDDLPPELLPIVHALNDLLEKIALAMTAQHQFVADAAHELRSPLTALKLQLQLAERAHGDEARALAFEKLHTRLERTSHLVQQLLTLARHESDQAVAPAAPVELHRLAQLVVADHSTYADSKGIDLGVAGGAHGVIVAGHADALTVLLNNLVDNALRYTPAGGQVDVSAAIEHGRALLRVADNGPGVAPQYRPRLFDRFYRPDGNSVWGSGLGLAIVKNIADLHGAEINLDSGLAGGLAGTGLTVTIVFPLRAKPA